jgi:CCR4-NOT transcription complex subunit 2
MIVSPYRYNSLFQEGNALVLGTDLTTFGLNLNASESLYPNFISPFSDNTQSDEPNYKTPDCYMMHPPALKSEHLAKFQTETLFYMFYQLPRDVLQACAAQELYRREWRYHGELKIWLKPRTQQEIVQAHSNIQFIYFDIKSWESRLFNAQIRGNLIAGLIPEEEIRVKAPLPGQTPLSEPS